MLICRSPVRISFGGGGTDLKEFYDKHGGAVLSTTIDKYFYSVLTERDDKKIEIDSTDYQLNQIFNGINNVSPAGILKIPQAVLKYFDVEGVSIHMESEVPTGSGLGLSGAVSTGLVKLVSLHKNKPLSKKEIAQIASHIEIEILKRPIGMQDQCASASGGLNFIEFDKDEIKVTPLKLSETSLENLKKSILLFYTGASRDSADILSEQKKATKELDDRVIKSLQKIKETAYLMKELLEKGDIVEFGKMMHKSWIEKKNISTKISNPYIDKCYQVAMEKGALGGKVTGAGGGGFLMFICEPKNQEKLREALIEQGLKELKFNFETEGTCVILEQHYYNRKLITPDGYLVAINSIVKKVDRDKIQEIIDIILNAYRKNKQIFIFGNGGSAATSSHFACDLNKTVSIKGKPLFKAMALTDNVSLMTAWGNDTSFDNIFYGQMLNFFNKGDVALGISGGGNSPSVLKALQYANEMDSPTIALTGFNGGKVKDIAKTVLIVPVHNYQLIEDVHVILVHLIASVIKETLTD